MYYHTDCFYRKYYHTDIDTVEEINCNQTEPHELTTHIPVCFCFFSGGGVDYGPLPAACNPLSFSASSGSPLCCNIPINDDNLVENVESFSVTLTTTDSNNANLLAPTTAIVNIADNDSKSSMHALEIGI